MTITDAINRTIDRLDVTKLTHVDLSTFDLRNVEVPKFELPKFDLPTVELPEFPNVDLPVDAERVAGWVRDAAYVGVGAAVVVGQQAEQRVRTLATTVSGAVSDAVAAASETVSARVRTIGTTVSTVVTDVVR
jgi:hypothetical protein